ncbi:MAG: hypothetical protein QNL04_07145 [SAR324 cluster bacterium]|nr:hypothetical protein [SAR324 cluster bacterium]
MKAFMLIFYSVFFLANSLFAQIGYKALTADRIELKTLKISKDQFFAYTRNTILSNPLGLGVSTLVPFELCDYPVKGKKLSSYNTPEGKGIIFLSSPSCKQIVLRKVLVQSYDFKGDNISNYRNRQCLLDITEIIGPLLQFFATQIEEPAKKDCPHCQSMAQYKAKVLYKAQGQINKTCGVEAGKTAKFVADFSQVVEASMKEKVAKLGK